jgi:hypothetical protein
MAFGVDCGFIELLVTASDEPISFSDVRVNVYDLPLLSPDILNGALLKVLVSPLGLMTTL